jgi:hypothetical protein
MESNRLELVMLVDLSVHGSKTGWMHLVVVFKGALLQDQSIMFLPKYATYTTCHCKSTMPAGLSPSSVHQWP